MREPATSDAGRWQSPARPHHQLKRRRQDYLIGRRADQPGPTATKAPPRRPARPHHQLKRRRQDYLIGRRADQPSPTTTTGHQPPQKTCQPSHS